MRHAPAAVWFFVVASSLARAGERKPLETKVEKSGVELLVRIEEGELPASGQPITITLSLTNRRKKSVEYAYFRDKCGSFELILQDEHGRPIPETRFGKKHLFRLGDVHLSAMVTELAPGGTVTHTINLARFHDLTDPGLYMLKVQKGVMLAPQKYMQLETEPLRFVVCGPCPAEWPTPPSGWPNPHKLRDWRTRGMSPNEEWREEAGDDPETPRPVPAAKGGGQQPTPPAGAEEQWSVSPIAAAAVGGIVGLGMGLLVGFLFASKLAKWRD